MNDVCQQLYEDMNRVHSLRNHKIFLENGKKQCLSTIYHWGGKKSSQRIGDIVILINGRANNEKGVDEFGNPKYHIKSEGIGTFAYNIRMTIKEAIEKFQREMCVNGTKEEAIKFVSEVLNKTENDIISLEVIENIIWFDNAIDFDNLLGVKYIHSFYKDSTKWKNFHIDDITILLHILKCIYDSNKNAINNFDILKRIFDLNKQDIMSIKLQILENYDKMSKKKRPNMSKGEYRISIYLDNLNVKYIYDKESIKDLKNKEGNALRPDFIIEIPCGDEMIKIWIEYDGEHHFQTVIYGDKNDKEKIKKAQENFEKMQENDRIKNEYAKENGWHLIRIPYWDFNNIEKILDEVFNLYL